MTISLKDIEWDGPIVNIIDELIERWFEAHPKASYDADFERANEWADKIAFARAKPLAEQYVGKV
jgi:hypothetical protein